MSELKQKIEIVKKNLNNCLLDSLEIELTHLSNNKVCGQMPVNKSTKQPFGYLHGGASVALAETLASIGGYLNCEGIHTKVFGIEINANHIKAMKDGYVYGEAKPIHSGKSTQVWIIEIKDSEKNLICSSRCTLGVYKLSLIHI